MKEIIWEKGISGGKVFLKENKRRELTPAKLKIIDEKKMTDISVISATFSGETITFETLLWCLREFDDFITFLGFYRPSFSGESGVYGFRLANWCKKKKCFSQGGVRVGFMSLIMSDSILSNIHQLVSSVDKGVVLSECDKFGNKSEKSIRFFIRGSLTELELEYPSEKIENIFLKIKLVLYRKKSKSVKLVGIRLSRRRIYL
ncbi:hypothetical protein [Microbulbifer sp. TYP-18]|uniref:hypothetical protein n=1 Tax=Microbulbifer sp. TYP-18 TaxID=3230024 RepID=UPI0034C6C3AA